MPASVQICSVRNWERWGRLRNVRLLLWAVNGWLFSAWKNARKSCSSRRRLCVLNCTGREFLRKTMREQLPV